MHPIVGAAETPRVGIRCARVRGLQRRTVIELDSRDPDIVGSRGHDGHALGTRVDRPGARARDRHQGRSRVTAERGGAGRTRVRRDDSVSSQRAGSVVVGRRTGPSRVLIGLHVFRGRGNL